MLWSLKPTDPETALGHRSRTFVKMWSIHISKQIPSPSTHILVKWVTETDYLQESGRLPKRFTSVPLHGSWPFFSSAQNKLLLDQFFHLQVCPICEHCRLRLWQPQRNVWWTWSPFLSGSALSSWMPEKFSFIWINYISALSIQ